MLNPTESAVLADRRSQRIPQHRAEAIGKTFAISACSRVSQPRFTRLPHLLENGEPIALVSKNGALPSPDKFLEEFHQAALSPYTVGAGGVSDGTRVQENGVVVIYIDVQEREVIGEVKSLRKKYQNKLLSLDLTVESQKPRNRRCANTQRHLAAKRGAFVLKIGHDHQVRVG